MSTSLLAVKLQVPCLYLLGFNQDLYSYNNQHVYFHFPVYTLIKQQYSNSSLVQALYYSSVLMIVYIVSHDYRGVQVPALA